VAPAPAPAPQPAQHSAGVGAIILNAALAQIGRIQDCTALVTNAIAAAGINFHGWPAGYLQLGTITAQPQPGDLIYYANGGMGVPHIAVYAGGGMAVHGGWMGDQTVEATAYVGSGPVFIHI
jgi:cell wall-associated NlpC family hydrolase